MINRTVATLTGPAWLWLALFAVIIAQWTLLGSWTLERYPLYASPVIERSQSERLDDRVAMDIPSR